MALAKDLKPVYSAAEKIQDAKGLTCLECIYNGHTFCDVP